MLGMAGGFKSSVGNANCYAIVEKVCPGPWDALWWNDMGRWLSGYDGDGFSAGICKRFELGD